MQFNLKFERLSIERYSFEMIPLILLFICFEWFAKEKEFPLYSQKQLSLKVSIVIAMILVFGNFSRIQDFIYFQFKMKRFLTYTCFLFLITLLLLYVFDAMYTRIYGMDVPRSQVQWVKSLKKNDTLDYILLGSSRCKNHIQPNLIEKISGKKGLNLGSYASGSFEVKLFIKEFLKYGTTKKVFIQVDADSFNSQSPNDFAKVIWMPFIKEKDIYSDFYEYDSDIYIYKVIPFYRYLKFEPKIGFRNTALILMGKKGNFLKEKGFTPTLGVMKNFKVFNFKVQDFENRNFTEIIELCKSKNIQLVFFTAPIYNSSGNLEILDKYLTNYYDLSNSVKDKKLFKNRTHLNIEGSRIFTLFFVDTFFNERSTHKGSL